MRYRALQVETDLLAQDADLAALLSSVLGSPADPRAEVERRMSRELAGYKAVLWEGDPETFQFTYVSPSAEALFGYPCSKWMEPGFWTDTIVLSEDRTAAAAFCALATGRGADHDFSYRARTADGRTLLIHDVVQVIKGSRAVAVRLRGVMLDVTDRAVYEAA